MLMEEDAVNYSVRILSRMAANDAYFLTLREKIIFCKFLQNDAEGNHFSSLRDFESRFLSLTITDVSIAVKRVFPRAKWSAKDTFNRVKIAEKILEAQNIKSVCILEEDFPALLRIIPDPPFMLFYRGNLEILKKRCVSVVGTRKAFTSSLKAASDFSKEACDDGLCVVSGLAFGIDAASHKGALLSQTPATCAVLPSGIDMITPQSNMRLAVKILEKGGLIMSEYLPGTPSVPFRYVQRNRIVAALSPGTIVVQAQSGSGAMITADLALDYNRDVFFHTQCFLENAATNPASQKGSSPKTFVDDGAKIIKNYSEFKSLLQ